MSGYSRCGPCWVVCASFFYLTLYLGFCGALVAHESFEWSRLFILRFGMGNRGNLITSVIDVADMSQAINKATISFSDQLILGRNGSIRSGHPVM